MKIKNFFKKIVYGFVLWLIRKSESYKDECNKRKLSLPASVNIDKTVFVGNNIFIGERTYINKGGVISSGRNSRVHIGEDCAIGRWVHISSKTHSFHCPTTLPEHPDALVENEADVEIGNGVWIGDKVYIGPGVRIGDYAIIGASAVVTKDVKPFEIVAGIPAHHIRFNIEHIKYGDYNTGN